MDALARFEALVENLLEGSLTRMLRGQLQPVEIAKRLTRAMEDSKTISVGRTFAANEYHVYLSSKDFQRLEAVRSTMEHELAEYLTGVAREQRLSLISKPAVKLEARENLPTRQVRVEARLVEQPSIVAPAAQVDTPLDIGHTRKIEAEQVKRSLRSSGTRASLLISSGASSGARNPIDKPTVTLGRGLGNDVVLDDPRVSRHHAEIRVLGGKYCLYDLKSTNGTHVNGQRITERVLSDGDTISLGETELVFENSTE